MNELDTFYIIKHLTNSVANDSKIEASIFEKYCVKCGLRNVDYSGKV